MEREQVKFMMQAALSEPDVERQRHIFRCMQAIDDERKETCIHCRSVWYAIHYKDGVCHGCQQKRLPGRSEIEARERRAARIRFWFVKMPILVGIVALLAGRLIG